MGTILGWLVAGFISWDIVKPESFGGAIIFIIAWIILANILQFIYAFLYLAIIRMFNK
jgi:hypothetical protein